MDTFNYTHQYNLLRRYAQEWGIEYTRYSHEQLRHAMVMNGGKATFELRHHLLNVIPLNGYYSAKHPQKMDSHETLPWATA